MTKEKPPVKIRFRTKKHISRRAKSVNFNFLKAAQPIENNKEENNKESKQQIVKTTETDLTDEQKSILMKWIEDNLSMINTINKRNTIHELIDLFEKTKIPNFSITTNQFAEVMLESGFTFVDGRFNVSGVSVKKLYKIIEKMERLQDMAIPAQYRSLYD